MSKSIITVKNLHKSFKLPHEKHQTIKSTLINFGNRKYENLEVLKDINFEVKEGEFFGIVGRNGGGKSTILKLLAQIYKPTKGEVHVDGQLTPFIELGVGFNPELSGYDNVFLNGALLGLTRDQIAEKYNAIVEFAELEKFMDQKLKNYSSGMQVRLAFSIAIQAYTDVLLIDEVLAVGDVNFQRKCYNFFEDLKKQNKTVVFVSHDMDAIQRFCDRAMIIEKGKMTMIGKPSEVAEEYYTANFKATKQLAKQTEEKLTKDSQNIASLTSINIGNSSKNWKAFDKKTNDILVRANILINEDINDEGLISIVVNKQGQGPVFWASSSWDDIKIKPQQKNSEINIELKIQNVFSDGSYKIDVVYRDQKRTQTFMRVNSAAGFDVIRVGRNSHTLHPEYNLDIQY